MLGKSGLGVRVFGRLGVVWTTTKEFGAVLNCLLCPLVNQYGSLVLHMGLYR